MKYKKSTYSNYYYLTIVLNCSWWAILSAIFQTPYMTMVQTKHCTSRTLQDKWNVLSVAHLSPASLQPWRSCWPCTICASIKCTAFHYVSNITKAHSSGPMFVMPVDLSKQVILGDDTECPKQAPLRLAGTLYIYVFFTPVFCTSCPWALLLLQSITHPFARLLSFQPESH